MFDEFDFIHRYTRAQALEDGVLIDVSDSARAIGIKFPTAMTWTVWCRCIEIPPGTDAQDEAGRLWELLWMMRLAISRSQEKETDTVLFDFFVHNNGRREKVTLKAVCGPSDDASPCITIMMPDED